MGLPSFSTSESNWASHKKTVYFYTDSVSGPLASVVIDATSEYNAGASSGVNDVTISAAGWDNGSNVVTASNGKTLTINLPTFSSSQSGWSSHKKTVYFSTPSVDGPLKTEVVDATSEYNAGLADAVGSMVSGPTIYNIYQDAANKKVTFDIGYRLNGQSTMTYVSKEISASDIYTSGYNTGFAAVGFASGPTITNQAEDDEYNRVGFDLVYQLDNQSSAVTRHYTIATPTIYNRAYQAGYNAGYTAGGNDAVGSMVSGPTLYNVNQNTANQKVTFDVGYKLNGQSTMTYVSKEVSANSIYTSGYNSGYTIGLNKGKQDGANGITISSIDYETYYIEEVDNDTEGDFVLPDYLNKDLNYGDQLPFDNQGHPVVKYILPQEDANNPASVTAEIKNVPSRVRFEKRDSKYNYLIPDETTTFKVYRCKKNTECHPSENDSNAVLLTIMHYPENVDINNIILNSIKICKKITNENIFEY